MRVCSSKLAISIGSNDVKSNDLAGYEERTRVLYMILDLHLYMVRNAKKVGLFQFVIYFKPYL